MKGKKEDKDYKKYEKIRNTLYELMDKYGQEEVLNAMAHTLTDTMEDDALDLIKESLEISKDEK